jgi:hypothetical protein
MLSRTFSVAAGVQAQAKEALSAQDGAPAAAVQVPRHEDYTGMSRLTTSAAYQVLWVAGNKLATDATDAVVKSG